MGRRELAEKSGIHPKKIHRIASDSQLAKTDDLIIMAAALTISPSQLLEGYPPQVGPAK